MTIVEINSVEYGSTGKICIQIAKKANENKMSVFVCTSGARKLADNTSHNRILIGNKLSEKLHLLLDRISGFNGCFSFFATLKFIRKIKKLNPDIIHLHNLHNCYINLPLLFKYIKKNNIKVVWTLHDCWAFTGKCPHFVFANCDKWKTSCYNCPQVKSYPKSYTDRTKTMYRLKKKWFTKVKDLTIITPSEWLAGLVKQSFLKDYPVKVINNGIDLDVFTSAESDFREKYNLHNKKIVLGVASPWSNKKGLDVFIELSRLLDENYQIVLVGTDESADKQLPKNIISIHRTHNQTELAKIYTTADVFVNPTKEDTFPTVNIEALACGTPVLTFDTGGSPEIIDKTCGSVVDYNDVNALKKEIIRICSVKPYSKENCLKRAKHFNQSDKFEEYICIYERIAK